ncbi:MAG: hypothetical protein ACYCPW_03745 [Nitrososphaerales archaeon]
MSSQETTNEKEVAGTPTKADTVESISSNQIGILTKNGRIETTAPTKNQIGQRRKSGKATKSATGERTSFPSNLGHMTPTEIKALKLKKDSIAAICVEKLESMGVEKEKRKEVFKAMRERQGFKDFADSTIRTQIGLAVVYLQKAKGIKPKPSEAKKRRWRENV